LQTERRILTNTAVLGLGEAVGQIAGFVFVVLCARAYGAGILGWYSLGMAAGAIAAVTVKFGTQGRLLRALARRPEESAARIAGALPYQVGASALAWLAIVAVVFFVTEPVGRRVISAVGGYHVTLAVTGLLLLPFVARQIMWPASLASAVQRVAVLLCAAPLIALGFSIDTVILAYPLTAILVTVAAFVAARSFLGDPLAWAPNSLEVQRGLYAEGLPFFGTNVLTVLHARLGLLMIAPLAGEESTGLYAAADRLIVVFGILQALFISAVHPAFLRLAGTDRDRALELAQRCMRLMLVLTIPLAGLAVIFSRDIVLFTFGPAFEPSAPVLVVLAIALVVRGVNSMRTSQAVAIGLEHAVFRARAAAVLLFAIAAVTAIVLAGPLGLAAALLLSSLAYAVSLHRILARERFAADAVSVSLKPIVAVLAGALVYLALDGAALPLRAVCVAASILVAVFALGVVRGHDLRYLRAIMAQKPDSRAA